MDFAQAKQKLRGCEMALLGRLLPQGKVQGHEYVALNPTRCDKHLGSFRVNLSTFRWADFATEDKGGDIISLWAYARGINNCQALNEISQIIGIKEKK